MSSWIKLHRSLKDWEWYDDKNAVLLLIHLLVSVNYEDKKWHGNEVKAGSLITSWTNLSKECGLTVKQTRVAMKKLEECGEVARLRADKWQVVTLIKWEKLQCTENKRAGKRADKGQLKGRQRATTKEYKEIKEVKNIYREFDHLSISVDEVERLKGKYTVEQIDDMLDRIQNYSKNTSYKDLNLTLQNWLKREYPEQKTRSQKAKDLINNF